MSALTEKDLINIQKDFRKKRWGFSYNILDNDKLFCFWVSSPRIEWNVCYNPKAYAFEEFTKESFIKYLENLEQERYFEERYGVTLSKSLDEVRKNLLDQFRQLDKKNLKLPQELTIHLELKLK